MEGLPPIVLALGGLVYACLFMALLWRWPSVGMVFIFALTPFQQDISPGGVKFSMPEVNLLLAMPVLFLKRGGLRLGPLWLPVGCYLAIGAASSLLNWTGQMDPYAMAGLVSYVQMVEYWVLAVGFFCVMPRRAEEYRLAWIGLIVVCLLLVGVLLVQRSQYVLGLHKNGIGSSMACGFVVATELWFASRTFRQRLLASGALLVMAMGLILSLSRGSWLGAFFGVMLIITLRRQFRLVLALAVILAPLAFFTWGLLPEEAREIAVSVDAKRENIRLRYESVTLAKNWFLESPIYGQGIGLRKRYDATNVLMLKLAETGVPGLVAFLWMHAAFFWMLWQAQRGLPRTDPLFSALSIGGGLVLYKFGHGCVDHYWARGALMCACGGAGMTVRVHFEMRARRRAARRHRAKERARMEAEQATAAVPGLEAAAPA